MAISFQLIRRIVLNDNGYELQNEAPTTWVVRHWRYDNLSRKFVPPYARRTSRDWSPWTTVVGATEGRRGEDALCLPKMRLYWPVRCVRVETDAPEAFLLYSMTITYMIDQSIGGKQSVVYNIERIDEKWCWDVERPNDIENVNFGHYHGYTGLWKFWWGKANTVGFRFITIFRWDHWFDSHRVMKSSWGSWISGRWKAREPM